MPVLLFGAVVLCGLAGGVLAYTFVYARGASYLGNDPSACVNCHVMREQFTGWERGSHRAVATCNDCHAPHDLAGKYWTKALNGFRHSWAFTTGVFPEPIRITARNEAVTEGACRSCHGAVAAVLDPHPASGAGPPPAGGEPVACIACHRSVGHLH